MREFQVSEISPPYLKVLFKVTFILGQHYLLFSSQIPSLLQLLEPVWKIFPLVLRDPLIRYQRPDSQVKERTIGHMIYNFENTLGSNMSNQLLSSAGSLEYKTNVLFLFLPIAL
jgi:hypothetical protein